MNRKHTGGLVFLSALVISALVLLGHSGKAAAQALDKPNLTEQELIEGSKKEKALAFYTSIPIGLNEEILKAFKDKYPWVEPNSIRGGGPVLAQRFYAEKAQGIDSADVVNSGSGEVYPDWRRLKYLAKVDNLPEYPAIRKIAREGGDYVAFAFVSIPMFWNNKLLKAEQVPDDLWEFTKPEWKDKTASGNPVIGGNAMNWFSWVCECRKQHPLSNRPVSGLGFKWIEGMVKNNILLPGQQGPLNNAIVAGQRALGVQQNISEIVRAVEQGAPLDYKYPKQGTMGQHWIGAINAKAPHPYTSRLFLNWCMSKEGQMLVVKKLGFHSAREDIDTAKYFPLKNGTVRFEDMWILDIEAITAEETKNFVDKLATTLNVGKGG